MFAICLNYFKITMQPIFDIFSSKITLLITFLPKSGCCVSSDIQLLKTKIKELEFRIFPVVFQSHRDDP